MDSIKDFYIEMKENTRRLLDGLTVEHIEFPENTGKPLYAETISVIVRLPEHFTAADGESKITLHLNLDSLTKPVRGEATTL